MMPIIDTHCHYNMEPLYSGQPFIFKLPDDDPLLTMSWQEHWQQAQAKGVIGSVVVGTMIATSDKAIAIADQDPNLLAAIGVHPVHAHEVTISDLDQAARNWANKTIHAVGETGLDFYRLDPKSEDFDHIVKQQQAVFSWHLKLATQLDLPIIIHVRDKTDQAYWQVLEIIKKHYQGNKPFVLHCASGPKEYISEAIALGAYIGLDCNITYPNAQDVRDLVKSVPADRLMIETDAPFLPPQPYRGKVCEPWMITAGAKFAATELGINLDQLIANTERFFNHQFVK